MLRPTRLFQTIAAAALVVSAALMPGDRASAQSTGFEGYPVGTLGSTLGIPGVSFHGSPDNQWVIYPGGYDVNGVFSTVSGHILIDPIASGQPTSSLVIEFDSVQPSVSFKLVAGHKDGGVPTITAVADNNGAPVYNNVLSIGVPPGSNYYAGTYTIPGPLTRIELTSNQSGFGIDDLNTFSGPVFQVPTDIIIRPMNPVPPVPTPVIRIPVLPRPSFQGS